MSSLVRTRQGNFSIDDCYSLNDIKNNNYKLINITDAFDNFSFDNLGASLSELSDAFGFNIDFENHKLGTKDHIRYRNVTDLTIKLEKPIEGALYLKNDIGSVYKENEWFPLPKSAYDNKLFKNFNEYEIYPQDYPEIFEKYIYDSSLDNSIWIVNSDKKKKYVYSPYGSINNNSEKDLKLKYLDDLTVVPDKHTQGQSSYKFRHVNTDSIIDSLEAMNDSSDKRFRFAWSFSDINNDEWKDKLIKYYKENYPNEDEDYISLDCKIPYFSYLYAGGSDGRSFLAELMLKDYEDFVYNNYLSVPDNDSMQEVREKYADILNTEHSNSVADRVMMLDLIRESIAHDCEYSLQPGKTPSTRDFVNYFLLENKKGFCTHFASAGVILARMAGIPARYVTGYIVVENDVKSGKTGESGSVTIDVKDNRSHAWAEVYIDEFGWIPYEFTAGYSSTEINTDPTEATTTADHDSTTQTTTNSSKSTSSGSNNSSTTVNQTTSAAATTEETTVTNKSGLFGFGFGNGNGRALPGIIKKILIAIAFLGAVWLSILLRRKIILAVREKRLTTGSNISKIIYIYNYAEKLLLFKKLRSSNGNYLNFAEQIEKFYGDNYFSEGEFRYLTDIALDACYGNKAPENNDIKRCLKTVNDFSEKLYKRSNFIDRLKIKYINVLK